MTGPAGVGDPWLDDAPSYAIGALDGEERATFEAHLATCAACAAEVRAYGEVATVLAREASDPAPAASPALRARIVAAALATHALPIVAPVTASSNAHPIRSRTATASIRAITPPARRATLGTPWLAAAAVVLAAALGSGWARERAVRVAERRDAVVALQRVGDADARRAAADAEMRRSVAERDTLLAALTAPSVRVARLAAAGEPAAMRLLWNPERGIVVLTAPALPSPHAGKTYQLWGIVRGGAPQSLGVFAPGANGAVTAVMHVPREAAMQVAAVTEEPAGGSVRPTGTPLMVGDLRGS